MRTGTSVATAPALPRKVVQTVPPVADERMMVADGSAVPASPNSTGLSPAGTAERIQWINELPPYDAVLTAEGAIVSLRTDQREHVAAIQVGPRKALILLHGDGQLGSDDVGTLRSRLRGKHFDVVGVAVASSLVFKHVNTLEALTGSMIVSGSDSIKLFDQIVEGAVHDGSSDIHICIREQSATVLYRIHSVLVHSMYLARSQAVEAVGVAYNKLAIETSRSKKEPQFNPARAQYCMIDRTILGRRWRLRYQSIKTEGGCDIVIRLLHGEAVAESKTIAELGYEESQQKVLNLAMMRAVGAIFISGVTGSGKSTTLMSMMTMDRQRSRYKYYSVEEPVEYRIYGVSQIPVQRDTSQEEDSAPFKEAIRILMRGDPDVIMIGEIRDKDTADTFVPAVQSGHRVLTTVHASSALGIVTRLTSAPIYLPRDVLTARRFISLLAYQALIPTVCPHCSLPLSAVADQDYLQLIEEKFQVSTTAMRAVRDAGCEHCRRGVTGQTVVAEMIMPDNHMLRLLSQGLDVDAEIYWRQSRRAGFDSADMTGKTAMEHGIYKATCGIVDPRDVEHAFESFYTYEVMPIVSPQCS